MYVVNFVTYKNDPKLANYYNMAICGDRDPSHDDYITTQCFLDKESMINFCVDYLNRLELFYQFHSDEEYLVAKEDFGRFHHIDDKEQWTDRVLSLEEKEDLIRQYYISYGDDADWVLRLVVLEVSDKEYKQLYI